MEAVQNSAITQGSTTLVTATLARRSGLAKSRKGKAWPARRTAAMMRPGAGSPWARNAGEVEMPRTIQLTVPPERSDTMLDDLRELGPLALRRHRGASLQPPGDVFELEVTNNQLGRVMRIADRHGLGSADGVAMSTTVPLSVIAPSFSAHTREPGATTWEELELSMAQESTMSADRLVVMLIAGVVAGAGIVSGSIHVVIGAMVIAPGFQPFARLVLGMVNRSAAWRGGLVDIARGYAALGAGSACAAGLSLLLGGSALDARVDGYLEPGPLLAYWSTTTWPGVAVGVVAGAGGGLLMSINRTVLTAGVMVALALVPSASLVSMGLIAGDLALAAGALLRFVIEAALVIAGCTVVFILKRRVDRRSTP